MQRHWDVMIVGGGAAGIFAAIRSAERGLQSLLIEKNRKLGVKILISGGTRCNITHAATAKEILQVFRQQAPFLRHAIGSFGPERVIELIEAEGVATKVEETGKIFPKSDRASDVVAALRGRLQRSGCQVKLDASVISIESHDGQFVITTKDDRFTAQRVVITTGGKSYPECGTTGDGYAWAKQLGHTIEPTFPALVPITSNATWVSNLKGVSLTDAELSVCSLQENGSWQVELKQRGAMLFTHFGISGPIALDVSRVISEQRTSDEVSRQFSTPCVDRRFELRCNLVPEKSESECEKEIQLAAHQFGGRHLIKILATTLPRRLAEVIVTDVLQLPSDLVMSQLAKKDRRRLVQCLCGLSIPVSGTRGYKKAEVTAGGICLNEIDPKSMQSRLCPNLYFAGEILNIDGPIGGYNFQAAFSTGWLAGSSLRA